MNYKAIFVAAILCSLFSQRALAQAPKPVHSHIPVYVNDGVFVDDPDVSAVLLLYQNYLNSNPDSVYDNPYWNAAEKHRYAKFDLLSDGAIPLYSMAHQFKPTVLSIGQESDHYRIRTMFAEQVDSGFSSPIAIVDVIAKKELGEWKLFNAISFNTTQWQHTKVGSVNFICPPEHRFEMSKALHLSRFIDSLTRLWGVPQRNVDYYFADNLDVVEQAKGMVYQMGYGNADLPAGRADARNAIVYSGGLGEYYPHEFVHIYLHPLYPNAHPYFHEGYATLLGGSRGKPLSAVLVSADNFLKAHPSLDLDSLLVADPSANLDYATNASYAFGGLICKLAEAKGGLAAIKKLFTYPNTSAGLFDAIYDTFGVKKNDVGIWLREKISEEAAKP